MKKHFFLLLQIILSNNLVAQNPIIDSINFEKILHFNSINNDSLIYYGKKLQESNNNCLKQKSMMHVARGYYQNKDYDIAEEISLQVIKISENTNNLCQKKIQSML